MLSGHTSIAVQPDTTGSALAAFSFKKPVPTTPPLERFPGEFLARLRTIEGNTRTVALQSGREVCYFDESPTGKAAAEEANGEAAGESKAPASTSSSSPASAASLPVVVCLHGGGQSKELWMQPEPVPNCRIIAIDRIGSGGSSPQPVPYPFSLLVQEIGEFLDKIGVGQFFLVGHSIGGGCAQSVAAGLGAERVLACASISGQCDLYHATGPRYGTKEWKALTSSPMVAKACGSQAGCWGGCIRHCILKKLLGSMMYAAHKDRDFGFAGLYTDSMRKGDGGGERTWSAMDANLFFVSVQLYSTMHGGVDTLTPLGDIWRAHAPWDIDVSDYKGPMFIYNGKVEITKAVQAEQIHRAVPQSQLNIMDGHGHTTIMMEAPGIIQALIKGEMAAMAF